MYIKYSYLLLFNIARNNTSPGDSTLQISCCTATYHLSRKLPKLDEPDMQETAGEIGTSSQVIHMDEQSQDVQHEPT